MYQFIKCFVAGSLLIASSGIMAQVKCTTPINIEIYDERSRDAANLLKKILMSKMRTSIKVENIVYDNYGYARRKLPYVHTSLTIFSRKKIDRVCISETIQSLVFMGIDSSDIVFRAHAKFSNSQNIRVSFPPRTVVD